MKKLISLILAFAMIFSLAMPAMAAEPTTNGNTSSDVTASYTPSTPAPAVITSVSITVDGQEYTSGHVTITPNSTVELTAIGTNLQSATADNQVFYAEDYSESLNSDRVKTSADGTRATWIVQSVALRRNSNFEITYYNKYVTAVGTPNGTGIFLTFENMTPKLPDILYFKAEGATWARVMPYDNNHDLFDGVHSLTMTAVPGEEGIFYIDTSVFPEETAMVMFSSSAGGSDGIFVPNDGRDMYDAENGVWIRYTPSTVAEAKWGTSADSLTQSGTLAEAIAAAEADSTITYIQLQSDLEIDVSVNIWGGAFILDLNGKTVICNDSYFVVSDGAVVTFRNGTMESNRDVVVAQGTVIFGSGTYKSTGSNPLMVYPDAAAVVTGGTFIGANYAINNMGTLTITGGTFSGGWASVGVGGDVNIIGGSFSAGFDGHFSYFSGNLDLSGYTGTITDLKIAQFTGADLTVGDENIILPQGYTFVDSNNNPVTTMAHETSYTIATKAVKYSITLNPVENGTVSANVTEAEAGETVTLYWTAASDYQFYDLYIEDEDGNYVDIDEMNLNDCTFIMPAANVTVTVEFKKIPTISAEIAWGSMSFTYDDTISDGEEIGWTCAEGANTITVTNTGVIDLDVTVEYAVKEGYEDLGVTGSFEFAEDNVTRENSQTFTLELSGKPKRALSGETIGTVTVTIEENRHTEFIPV